MNTTQFAYIADQVRKLPAGSAGRDRSLLRLTDLYASAEAAAALQAAARSGSETDILSDVLTLAAALWRGGADVEGAPADEAALRDRLCSAIESPELLSLVPGWVREMREIASSRADTGACTLGTAFQLWHWTMNHFLTGEGARGEGAPQAADELADVLMPLLAARCLALDVAAAAPPRPSTDAELRTDLCRVHAAHASAAAGAACAELVFGYRRHLRWDAQGCAACYAADELDELEGWMPGIASEARAQGDVIEADGSHAPKAGPCARFDGVDSFTRLRTRLDGCLTGWRFARDRAAAGLARSVAGTKTPSKASEGRA